MADTQTTSDTLKINTLFVDGDTRTITLKNPRSDLQSSDIESLDNFMKTNNILIGDKYGSDFRRIEEAKRVRTTTTTLDLS